MTYNLLFTIVYINPLLDLNREIIKIFVNTFMFDNHVFRLFMFNNKYIKTTQLLSLNTNIFSI